ncbi:hypothetical protein [Thiocapsa bogorovii]|nr:hypothetical protein [Thiocapsa bogorovii]
MNNTHRRQQLKITARNTVGLFVLLKDVGKKVFGNEGEARERV